MKSIRPLQEVSRDLAVLIGIILHHEPWDMQLVVKALQCYQAWADHAIYEEVKIEILFPYNPSLLSHDGSDLVEVFNANVHQFFVNSGTVWAAAEVFNGIAEKSLLPKATRQKLSEIITSGIVQESYHLYLNSPIGMEGFISISSLAITLAEADVDKLLSPLTPLNQKFLEMMLFLLDTEMSSRTFNFWASFAEAIVDVVAGHEGDIWLQQALCKLLDRSAWRDDLDDEEWNAYRADVVEVFEAICEVVEHEKLNSVVIESLNTAARKEDGESKVVVSMLLEKTDRRLSKQLYFS